MCQLYLKKKKTSVVSAEWQGGGGGVGGVENRERQGVWILLSVVGSHSGVLSRKGSGAVN